MRLYVIILAWTTFIIALTACGTVLYAHYSIGSLATKTGEQIVDRAHEADRAANLRRLTIVADATADQRLLLDQIVGTGLIEIASLLEHIGPASNVTLTVDSAVPRGSTPITRDYKLYSYDILISGEGSFANIMHAVSMIENLPIPSTLLSADVEYDQGSTWRMNLRLNVMTSANSV